MKTRFSPLLLIPGVQAFAARTALAQANATDQPPDISSMADIIDIRPAMDAGFNPMDLVLYAGLALAAGLLLLLAWLLVKKLRGREQAAPPPVEPHVRALEALDSLDGRIGELGAKQFYYRLSAIARQYIEDRFFLRALEMTTEELLPALRILDAEERFQTGLRDLFRFSDPVKYAGAGVAKSRMGSDSLFVREFVQATMKHEEESGEENGQERGEDGDV